MLAASQLSGRGSIGVDITPILHVNQKRLMMMMMMMMMMIKYGWNLFKLDKIPVDQVFQLKKKYYIEVEILVSIV